MSVTGLEALQTAIESHAITMPGESLPADTESIVLALLAAQERGDVRAAERGADGVWRAVAWVKRGILLGFRFGSVVDMSPAGPSPFRFFDKHTFPTQALTHLTLEHGEIAWKLGRQVEVTMIDGPNLDPEPPSGSRTLRGTESGHAVRQASSREPEQPSKLAVKWRIW